MIMNPSREDLGEFDVCFPEFRWSRRLAMSKYWMNSTHPDPMKDRIDGIPDIHPSRSMDPIWSLLSCAGSSQVVPSPGG